MADDAARTEGAAPRPHRPGEAWTHSNMVAVGVAYYRRTGRLPARQHLGSGSHATGFPNRKHFKRFFVSLAAYRAAVRQALAQQERGQR
jgi:hypothetical protein